MGYKELLIVFCVFISLPAYQAGRDLFLKELAERVEKEQITQDVPFRGLGQWQEIEGNYRNYYMSNFRGGPIQAAARHNSMVLDMDVFASHFTTTLLLEAQTFGNAPPAKKIEIERTVRMLGHYHDRNRPNSSVVLFYTQSYNPETGVWFSDPQNLYNVAHVYNDIMPFSLAVSMLGAAPLPGNLASAYTPRRISAGLRISGDFDSTFINLNLGGLLYEARNFYPEAWQIWADDNPSVETLFDIAKKYAYRPFSDDRNANSIDPRTYNYIRFFLDEAKRDGRDVALVPTFVQNTDELRTQYAQDIVSLFCINNIGLGVQTDVISGLFLAFSSGLVDANLLSNDPDLELIIKSTADLLVYELETNMAERRDLAALYYPSEVQFYWFNARNLMHMERGRQNGPLVPVFETFYQDLKSVLTTKISAVILESKQVDPCGGIFYDDFLGTADLTEDGQPLNRAEDRVYTTAMAANTLLYTWSVYNDSQKTLVWRDSVPDCVVDVIKGCVQWLEKNALSGKYLLTNAFFSADTKNRMDMLYLYPGNRFEYLENGTKIDDFSHLPAANTVYAVEGYIEPEEYERLMKMDKFGMPYDKEAVTFRGFNQGQGNVGIWSAESMTYGGVMMAVSMIDVLEGGKQIEQ